MAKANKPAPLPVPAQAPYLKHVRLRNYHSLRDVKADFKPGINIIIGKNGAGKTNFVGLLNELISQTEVKFRGVNSKLQFVVDGQEVQYTYKKALASNENAAIVFTFRGPDGGVPLKAEVKTRVKSQMWKAVATISTLLPTQLPITRISTIPVWHGVPTALPIVGESTDISFDDSGALTIKNAIKDWWGTTSLFARALVDALVPFDVGSPANAFTVLGERVVHLFVLPMLKPYLDLLNDYLPNYTPIRCVRLSSLLRAYNNKTNGELLVKGLVLEYQIENDWLPFDALSDGTKRLLYLVGELLMAADKGRHPITAGVNNIILLEEPELGIHPHQLHLLLQLIREVSKKHQVILTTHSPQVLDMLTEKELDRITICDFDPKLGTQMRKLSAEKRKKARFYIKDKGALSEFWRFSNLEDAD